MITADAKIQNRFINVTPLFARTYQESHNQMTARIPIPIYFKALVFIYKSANLAKFLIQ